MRPTLNLSFAASSTAKAHNGVYTFSHQDQSFQQEIPRLHIPTSLSVFSTSQLSTLPHGEYDKIHLGAEVGCKKTKSYVIRETE